MKGKQIKEIRQCIICRHWRKKERVKLLYIGKSFEGFYYGNPNYKAIKNWVCEKCIKEIDGRN